MEGFEKALAFEKAAEPLRPVIAVLPFTNMSGDEEQEYFADGITEDIITRLSRYGEIEVIGRNSIFQYKGRPVDVREVGQDRGARPPRGAPNDRRGRPRSRAKRRGGAPAGERALAGLPPFRPPRTRSRDTRAEYPRTAGHPALHGH